MERGGIGGGHGGRSPSSQGCRCAGCCRLLPPGIGERKRERKGGKKSTPFPPPRRRPRRRAVGASLREEREGTPPSPSPPSFSFAFQVFNDNLIPFKGKIGTDRVSKLPPRYWRAVVSSLRGACHICGTTKRDFTSGLFGFFFPFYPPPSPLFSPFAKKIKTLLQKAPALPFPVQTGPGQARESAGQTPSRGQVAREGVGEGWDSSSWSFSPEEEENEQLRLPGEAAAAVPSARSRTWSTVAARGGGKPPQKSGFLGSNHLPRGLNPRGGWCRVFPLLLAAFLIIFLWGEHL